MANTYTLIASSTVGSGGAATITFSSIPSTYTDLCLMISARSDSTAGSLPWDNILITFNSDTTTKYSMIRVAGDGSTASSASTSGAANIAFRYGTTAAAATANTFSNATLYIPNYASSNQKSVSGDSVIENNATAGGDNLMAGLYTGTSAISTITLTGSNGNFVQYSTAYLYGIKNS